MSGCRCTRAVWAPAGGEDNVIRPASNSRLVASSTPARCPLFQKRTTRQPRRTGSARPRPGPGCGRAHTGLSGLPIFRRDRPLDRHLEIGVVKDQERCVAAQLHRVFLTFVAHCPWEPEPRSPSSSVIKILRAWPPGPSGFPSSSSSRCAEISWNDPKTKVSSYTLESS
jgi:hypothetical protein